MKKPVGSKYSIKEMDSYEPGSRGRILRNKLGIKRIRDLEEKELELYMRTELWMLYHFFVDQQLTMSDIDDIHRHFMGDLFDWAGTHRTVNLSKGGFHFAAAHVLKKLTEEFDRRTLARCTPCFGDRQTVIDAIAEVHVEFVLLHPYREGNGRIARLISTLMAYQAGYPGLDFGFIGRRGKEFDRYIAAIHEGMDLNYSKMRNIVSRALRRAESKYAR